jgi:transposase
LLLVEVGQCYLTFRLVWADGGHSSTLVAKAASPAFQICIVAKLADGKTFTALPQRWVIERTFTWLSHYRRIL